MRLLSRTHTKHYFISIFIIVSALFVTFSAVVYRHFNEAQMLNEWTIYNYEVIRQSRRILFDLVNMETGVRGYLLSGDKRYLEPYESSQRSMTEQISHLWSLTKNDPGTHKNIDTWLTKMEAFSGVLIKQLEMLHNRGGKSISIKLLEKQRMEMDELRTLLEGNIQDRIKDLNRQLDFAKEKQQNFKFILVIGTILAVGGMMLATLVIIALLKRSQLAEEETRLAENRFLAVMNGINDGLYEINVHEGTVYFSPAYKEMLGYTEEEHPNTLAIFDSLLHPEDSAFAWDNVLRDAQETGKTTFTHIFRLRHKDDKWLWVMSRGVIIRDTAGKITRIIGTHTDISLQKSREEELQQLNSDMETFTYIASHDLRSPLVNLKGFAREMRQTLIRIQPIISSIVPSLTAAQRQDLHEAFEKDIPESLHFIEQSVMKMDSLTTAVLDLSRIGKQEYRMEPMDTNAIVQRCIDALAYEISQKGIRIICDPLPEIVSDPLAIEQIFSNLIDNAVKYQDSSRQGEIYISAQDDDSKQYTTFIVRDNGRGIADADKHKIFQIFRRARNTGDVRGLGMGMAFVQATIRRINGKIWFDSSEGVGTTFYIQIKKNNTKG